MVFFCRQVHDKFFHADLVPCRFNNKGFQIADYIVIILNIGEWSRMRTPADLCQGDLEKDNGPLGNASGRE